MLQSIRGFTGGIILKIFMGLIVLSFAVWGIGDFLHSSNSNDVAATVGGVSISAPRLAEEVRRQTARIRQMFGGQVPDEMIHAMNVDTMILKQMVQEELLKQGAEHVGLRVDNSVITRLIAGNPAFRDKQGKFDRERFRQFDEEGRRRVIAAQELGRDLEVLSDRHVRKDVEFLRNVGETGCDP